LKRHVNMMSGECYKVEREWRTDEASKRL
jgi:hypothetical protein